MVIGLMVDWINNQIGKRQIRVISGKQRIISCDHYSTVCMVWERMRIILHQLVIDGRNGCVLRSKFTWQPFVSSLTGFGVCPCRWGYQYYVPTGLCQFGEFVPEGQHIGSNDDVFWLESRRDGTKVIGVNWVFVRKHSETIATTKDLLITQQILCCL